MRGRLLSFQQPTDDAKDAIQLAAAIGSEPNFLGRGQFSCRQSNLKAHTDQESYNRLYLSYFNSTRLSINLPLAHQMDTVAISRHEFPPQTIQFEFGRFGDE